MAEMDVKLRERGLWIFDDSVQDPTSPADAQTSADTQQLRNAATSPVVIPAQQRPPLSELKEHASLPTEPAAIQHPLSDIQPQHLSETHQLSMSVYNPCGLELSARLWTSSAAIVKEGAGARDGDLTVEYKSGIVLPRSVTRLRHDAPLPANHIPKWVSRSQRPCTIFLQRSKQGHSVSQHSSFIAPCCGSRRQRLLSPSQTHPSRCLCLYPRWN